MKKFLFKAVVSLAIGGAASAVSAQALLNAPVPTNATITYNGLQWAWASPLDQNSVDLSYQSQFGWRLPTADELANAPTALQFIYAGANVPLGGTDPVSGAYWAYTGSTLDGAAALAAPYFSSFTHGDWCNGFGSNCGFGEQPWNLPANSYGESLVVRDLSGAVPEPATWAMMLVGFATIGFATRRRSRLSGSSQLA